MHLSHRLVADKALSTVRKKPSFHARETDVGASGLDGARSVRVLNEYKVNGVRR